MQAEFASLIDTVQHNCHIADAKYAGDYTLCVYLLKMREFYRWEKQRPFDETLTNDSVGDWLSEREAHWDDLETTDYLPLNIQGKNYDPFDNETINATLIPHGLVYNAGYGIRCRPHFFIGKLESHDHQNEFHIYISGEEYARDIASPAAMTQNDTIFIRDESLRRILWEKIEEWRWSRLDNPMGRSLEDYDFEGNATKALDAFSEIIVPQVVQHEIGEAFVGQQLGHDWNKLLNSLPRGKSEIMLRAIRDHLADSFTTLPLLISEANPNAIHFWYANLTGMQKTLAPRIKEAYQRWYETGKLDVLEQLIPDSRQHWFQLASTALTLFKEDPDNMATAIETKIETQPF